MRGINVDKIGLKMGDNSYRYCQDPNARAGQCLDGIATVCHVS
jgi:hypothetical protein